MPLSAIETIALVQAEAARVEEQCLVAAERHYAAETPWYHMNYFLGLPSAILALVAGTTALPKLGAPDWIPVTAGLLAAALTALLTFLDPNKRASVHHTCARSFETLYQAAGFLSRYEVQIYVEKPAALQDRLTKLNNDFTELLRSSPAIPGHAYRSAAAHLAAGTGEVLRSTNSNGRNSSVTVAR